MGPLDWSFANYFLSMPSTTLASLSIVLLLLVYFHIVFTHATASNASTILTTTGIFFTFLGIAFGLAEFDTANVEKSIPSLLSGLKTAFWASVVGVGRALSIKLRDNFAGARSTDTDTVSNEEVTAEELAKLLRAIQTALVGDDESTLISQLKLTRQDTNDRLDSLKKAQHEALQRLLEMGSAKLVDALREVIRDFNSKITEQFGENFKELNTAVGKLVQWQDRYRTHTEELTHQIMQITASMKESSEHYSSLVAKAEIFTRVSKDLSSLLSAIEVQKQQLISSLESLANLLQAASGKLPQIETKVIELVTQLSSAVRASQLEVNKSIAENGELLRTSIQQAGTQLANNLSEQQKELSLRVQEHVSAIRSTITAAGQEMGKANQEMNKQVADLTMKTKQHVTTLDEALSDELTKSLESLGRQLTALSQRFVEDYSPLTEKLRRVVELARG